jgi:hypothetical protein
MSHQETRPWGSFTVLEDTAHYKVKRTKGKKSHKVKTTTPTPVVKPAQ